MQSVSSKGQNAQHNCGIALQYTQFDVNSHKHSIRKETNILWPEFLFVIAFLVKVKSLEKENETILLIIGFCCCL